MHFPQLPLADVDAIIEANNVPRDQYPVVAVAFRGYWLDSVGAPGVNDRRYFDDAVILRWPDGVARFPHNTDPNGWRNGKGTDSGKGMASLVEGIHIFGTGLHRGKPGFRQCEPFTVLRDGTPPYRDTGWFAIDWHRAHGAPGSYGATDSEGCQTNPAVAWDSLQPLLYGLLDQYGNRLAKNDRGELVRSLPYVLLSEHFRRRGEFVVSRRYLDA